MRPNRFSSIIAVALVLVLAGCQSWQRIEAKQLQLSGGHSITPDRLWSAVVLGDSYHMTIDGPGLQSLVITSDISAGDPLIDIGPNAQKQLPVMESGMSILEVLETFQTTIEVWGFEQVKRGAVERLEVNGRTLTVQNLSMVNKAGLAFRGRAYIAHDDRGTSVFFYSGTDLYHFEKHIGDAEQIVRSVIWAESEKVALARILM